MRHRLILAFGLAAAASTAGAAPVAYTFATGANSFSSLSSLSGTSISGSFLYDPTTPLTFTTTAPSNPVGAAIYGPFLQSPGVPYSSYTNISATVSGGALGATSFAFSDPRGQITVSNDGLVSPPGSAPSDILSLDLDPFGATGTHNLTNKFSVNGFTLWNMRLFWLESTIGGDFLSNQDLPASLPSGFARVALDFLPDGTAAGTPSTFVFYENVLVSPAVAPVPEPATYALLLAGLGLLGFDARRRRRLAAQ